MSDHHFPEELLIEILIRIPAKSLIRFTTVSKSWRFLLTSPAFIDAYHRRIFSATNLLILRRFDKLHNEDRYSILNDTDHELINFNSTEISFPVNCRVGYYRALGFCNGVFCLSDDFFSDSHSVTLWNPSIRKLRTLPSPIIRPACPYNVVLGFGVDPCSFDDLRVVRVVYEKIGDNLESFVLPPKAEVYSLETGLWRMILATGVDYNIVDFLWTQAFVNGVVHWIGFRVLEDKRIQCLIAVFTIADESFGEIVLPDELAGESPQDLSIMVLEGSIAVIKYGRGVLGIESCEVWVMEEYGALESWTRLHFVRYFGGMERVVGFRKYGELLFSTSQGELVSYCPKTEVISNVGFSGSNRSFYVDKFLESLVLLQDQNFDVDELCEEMGSVET